MIILRMVMIGIMEILIFWTWTLSTSERLLEPSYETRQHIDGKIFDEYRQWLWWWGWCDDRNDEDDGDNRDVLSTSEWTLWSHLVIQGKCRAGFRSTSCVFLSISRWFSKVISFLLALKRLIYRGWRYIPDNPSQPVPMCRVLNPAKSSFTLHKQVIKPNCKISFITRTKITQD